jgi:hypothetical protein
MDPSKSGHLHHVPMYPPPPPHHARCEHSSQDRKDDDAASRALSVVESHVQQPDRVYQSGPVIIRAMCVRNIAIRWKLL